MILNNHNVPVNSQNHVKSCYSSSQVTADTLQQVFPAILRVISSSGRIRSFCFELDCLCMTHGKIIKCGSSRFVKQWSGRFFFYDLLQAAARWSLLHNAQILIHDVCPPTPRVILKLKKFWKPKSDGPHLHSTPSVILHNKTSRKPRHKSASSSLKKRTSKSWTGQTPSQLLAR